MPFFKTHPDALGPEHFEYTATAGPKRPVDVRFSRDGTAMYVVDVGAIAALPTLVPSAQPFPGTGVIWRIVREDAADEHGVRDVVIPPHSSSDSDQIQD